MDLDLTEWLEDVILFSSVKGAKIHLNICNLYHRIHSRLTGKLESLMFVLKFLVGSEKTRWELSKSNVLIVLRSSTKEDVSGSVIRVLLDINGWRRNRDVWSVEKEQEWVEDWSSGDPCFSPLLLIRISIKF